MCAAYRAGRALHACDLDRVFHAEGYALQRPCILRRDPPVRRRGVFHGALLEHLDRRVDLGINRSDAFQMRTHQVARRDGALAKQPGLLYCGERKNVKHAFCSIITDKPRRHRMSLPCRSARWSWSAAALAVVLIPIECRAQLPDGPGRDVVERACGACHPATMVLGRNLSREEWNAEVAKMVQQGAKLTDAEHMQVVDYLARTFPPAPNAAQAAAQVAAVEGG